MEEVSHIGTVKSVGPAGMVVAMETHSACSGCGAKGLCSAADAMEKDVTVAFAPGYSVGDEVEVVLKESLGIKAALLSYAVPVLLLIVTVVALSYTSLHELWTGVAGIGVVAIWYLVLYQFRGRLQKEYKFSIKKN